MGGPYFSPNISKRPPVIGLHLPKQFGACRQNIQRSIFSDPGSIALNMYPWVQLRNYYDLLMDHHDLVN